MTYGMTLSHHIETTYQFIMSHRVFHPRNYYMEYEPEMIVNLVSLVNLVTLVNLVSLVGIVKLVKLANLVTLILIFTLYKYQIL